MDSNIIIEKNIDISCIIINYNTSKYTIDCVESIIKNTKNALSYEIIVIDNASKIADYKALELGLKNLGNSDRLKLIKSKINLGFGAGNMLGIQNTNNCSYYAFINNDTLQVSDNCLGYLMDFMNTNPSVGITSPQMLDENKKFRVTIDHFSSLQREILRRALLEKINPKKYLNRKKTYDNPVKVDYVQGSFMLTRAKDFDAVGGFDTNLFLYYEESDLSLRLLKKRNQTTFLIPSLHYIHYKSASTSKGIMMKIEQKISMLYHTKKHYGWFTYKILLFFLCIRYFFTCIIKPKYLPLLLVLIQGAPLTLSLRQKQQIHNDEF